MSIQVYPAAMKINGDSEYTPMMCIRGPEGPQGPRGPRGNGLQINGTADSVQNLPTASEHEGESYMVGSTMYYSNGITWENAGSIQGPPGNDGEDGAVGPQGPQGLPAISGGADSVEELPAASQHENENYLVGGDLYKSNGTTWVNIGSIKGPKGDKGEQGPRGLPGRGIGDLDFDPIVLISNYEPNDPVEMLMWIENSANIDTGDVQIGLTTTLPITKSDGSALSDGDVYVMQSSVNLHPVIWGGIRVYPCAVWIYTSDAWSRKNGRVYVNNQWWALNSIWLIENGNIIVENSHGSGWYIQNAGGIITIQAKLFNSGTFTFSPMINANSYPYKLHAEGEINTEASVDSWVKFGGPCTALGTSGTSGSGDSIGHRLFSNGYTSTVIAAGTGYPGFGISGSGSGSSDNYRLSLKLKHLWLEFTNAIPE